MDQNSSSGKKILDSWRLGIAGLVLAFILANTVRGGWANLYVLGSVLGQILASGLIAIFFVLIWKFGFSSRRKRSSGFIFNVFVVASLFIWFVVYRILVPNINAFTEREYAASTSVVDAHRKSEPAIVGELSANLSHLDEGILYGVSVESSLPKISPNSHGYNPDEISISNIELPKSNEAFVELWAIFAKKDNKVIELRAVSDLFPQKVTKNLSDLYVENLVPYYSRRNCDVQRNVEGKILWIKCGIYSISLFLTSPSKDTGENRFFVEVRKL